MAIDGGRGVEARKSNQNCTDLDGVYVKSIVQVKGSLPIGQIFLIAQNIQKRKA